MHTVKEIYQCDIYYGTTRQPLIALNAFCLLLAFWGLKVMVLIKTISRGDEIS